LNSLETIANSLGGSKKTPEGYLCRCPCHEDKSASLSLKLSSSGDVITNCLAGCDWKDIKDKLKDMGLLEKRRTGNVEARPKYNKYEGATFYIYRDLVGNEIARKVKLANKKMWFERLEGNQWISGLAGRTIPLYNLSAVKEASTVYLCEGEKDAESLIAIGLTATTNHAGASSWASHLTEQLAGKTVIIIPDNDIAGKKRVNIVSSKIEAVCDEVRVFMPDGVPDHGDVTDWIQNGGNALTILEKSEAVKSKSGSKAKRDDYFSLFEDVLKRPKRCIFNQKLMTFEHAHELWNPAINYLDVIKSEAIHRRECGGLEFKVSEVLPHFQFYENQCEEQFLVDVPVWDGDNRIEAMAGLVKLKDEAGISANAFTELLKEWCSLTFERLEDPMIQNRVLVLQGGQGVGKDTWTSMLVDGLGQFCVPLSVMKEDKDTYLNIHRGLVMKISEFDKTAKAEVSTLKDIITAPETNLRAPYDRDAKVRKSRCSFISSANASNLLRDHTGNRRFLIVEIESIEYGYKGWSRQQIKDWQMQCLAEMKTLAAESYRASAESWQEMNEYIESKTPVSPDEEILGQFLALLREELGEFESFAPDGYIDYSPNDKIVMDIIAKLSRDTRLNPRGINRMLRDSIGVKRRVGDTRVRVLRVTGEAINSLQLTNSNTVSSAPTELFDEEQTPF